MCKQTTVERDVGGQDIPGLSNMNDRLLLIPLEVPQKFLVAIHCSNYKLKMINITLGHAIKVNCGVNVR